MDQAPRIRTTATSIASNGRWILFDHTPPVFKPVVFPSVNQRTYIATGEGESRRERPKPLLPNHKGTAAGEQHNHHSPTNSFSFPQYGTRLVGDVITNVGLALVNPFPCEPKPFPFSLIPGHKLALDIELPETFGRTVGPGNPKMNAPTIASKASCCTLDTMALVTLVHTVSGGLQPSSAGNLLRRWRIGRLLARFHLLQHVLLGAKGLTRKLASRVLGTLLDRNDPSKGTA